MIVGIIILLIGLICIVEILNPDLAINFDLLWPIVIIALATYKILADKKCNTWLILWLFVGFWWLFVELDFITSYYYPLFFPLVLVIIGTSMIIGSANDKKQLPIMPKEQETKGKKSYNGIFGGVDEKVRDENFKGAEVYSIFGGVDLDLRKAKIKEDIIINVYSIFGGTTIISPEDYNIVMHSTAIFGGNENKQENTYDEKRKTIHINCVSVFGGCEIK